ncbi:MAG: penicillin amidase [Ignavibacteriales bacterium UTCHB2]|jgi:penicillin amidase|nr:MAG: Acyl-homoserine lactone acylase QuiP precursor [Ignavibacteria bacterium ADurb.Bin266]OQY71688.1 MAG: penicillin amidase [Ignavibacteriales bacterium UTCHB2]HQI40948.1 penicillin acylase family protein [Ignavibacteriaceae bacterium]
MRSWKKILIGLSISFVIIFIVAGAIFYNMLSSSLPDYNGRITSSKIISDIEIYRDSFAVPYILAESDNDAAFALGYLHAQERLFTMDFIRRAGEGRLSEILGEEAIPFDNMFRTVGIKRNILKNYSKFDPSVISLLQSYSNGVNAYIEERKGNYSIEFDVLGYQPEKWKPMHSLIVIKMMAWELNISWWTDVTFSELIQKLGEKKAMEILPDYPENAPTIIAENFKYLPLINSSLVETDQAFRKFIGWTGTHLGSNNWVVNANKSKSGKPIIANDPHLAFSAPGKWYAATINSKEGWKASGVTLPGVPGIVIGKGENISWVLTNVMNDDSDFYVEKLDSSKTKYFLNGEWKDLKIIKDTIKVKSKKDQVIEIRETHRGPIISDIHPFNFVYNKSELKSPSISMKWSGNEFSDEMLGFYKINKAKNWNQFREGVKYFGIPGQNFVYADTSGNIGYIMGARIPLRKNNNPTLVFDGTTTVNDWQGFVPIEEIPVVLNPKENFIASANNKTLRNFKYHISNLWEPSSRIDRIRELLTSKEKHSAEDFKEYQMDMTSPYAKLITSHILKAFDGIKINDKNLKTALELLNEWDYELNKQSQTPAIYILTLKYLLHNIYYDELGEDLFNRFVFLANVPYRSLLQVLEKPESDIFDDINTPKRETKNEIIRKSLSDALTYLEENLGKDLTNWQWGRLHSVTFKHAFSGNFNLLDKYINIGPYEIGGDGTTINNTEYSFAESIEKYSMFRHNEFDNILGPSMRYIYDFAKPDEYYLILSTGQSGNVMSDNYRDQTPYWLKGKYMLVRTDESSIRKNKNLLIIKHK